MRWNVEGADGKTGKEQIFTIEADSAADAEQKARSKGVLVSAVHASAVQDPTDQLNSPSDVATRRSASAPAGATLPYRSPGKTSRAAPDYLGLRFSAGVLVIFAALYYIAGAMTLLAAIVTAVRGGQPSQVAGGIFGPFTLAIAALTMAMVGGLLQAMSEACVALRDITRNSFE